MKPSSMGEEDKGENSEKKEGEACCPFRITLLAGIVEVSFGGAVVVVTGVKGSEGSLTEW